MVQVLVIRMENQKLCWSLQACDRLFAIALNHLRLWTMIYKSAFSMTHWWLQCEWPDSDWALVIVLELHSHVRASRLPIFDCDGKYFITICRASVQSKILYQFTAKTPSLLQMLYQDCRYSILNTCVPQQLPMPGSNSTNSIATADTSQLDQHLLSRS